MATVLACGVGVGLRTAWLGTALVLGDEIHAIEVALTSGLVDVVTHFHERDNSIPLTAWAWILANTIGLEEWGLRLPAVVPGIALVVAVGYAGRRYLGPGEALLAVSLCALSPTLVYWSRQARPYALVSLAGGLTALAFFRLLERGRARASARAPRDPLPTDRLPADGRWAVRALVAGHALALWASPTYLPWCAGLIGLALLPVLFGERERRARRLRTLVLPQLGGLLLGAVLIAVAADSFVEVLGTKDARYERDPGLWLDVAAALFGFRTGLEGVAAGLPLVALLLAGLGVASLARARARTAAGRLFVATALTGLACGPFVAYVVVQVHGTDVQRVLLRYVAASVPLLLFLLAAGTGAVVRRFRAPGPRAVAGALVVASLTLHTLAGPYASAQPGPYGFGLEHSRLIRPYDLDRLFVESQVPRVYALPRNAGRTFVVWPALHDLLSFAVYQRLHRGTLLRYDPYIPRAGARFRTMITGRDALRERTPPSALWVVHRDVFLEGAYLMQREALLDTLSVRGLRPHENPAGELARQLGPPVFDDGWTVAFDPAAPPPRVPPIARHVDPLTDARIVQAVLPPATDARALARRLAEEVSLPLTFVAGVPTNLSLALRVDGVEGPTTPPASTRANARKRTAGRAMLFAGGEALAAAPRSTGFNVVRARELPSAHPGPGCLLVLWGRFDDPPGRVASAVDHCLAALRGAGGQAVERLTTSLVELGPTRASPAHAGALRTREARSLLLRTETDREHGAAGR